MNKARLQLVTPSIINRTVMPTRLPNADLRTREHLTEAEVQRLMDAAKKNRWGHRDATIVLVASARGAPFTTAWFARMVERAGIVLNSPLKRIRTC